MSKKLIDSIKHFDRFNTDKYVEVVNAKNGIENVYDEIEVIEEQLNSGCMNFIVAFLFLVCLISLVYILCYIGQ